MINLKAGEERGNSRRENRENENPNWRYGMRVRAKHNNEELGERETRRKRVTKSFSEV